MLQSITGENFCGGTVYLTVEGDGNLGPPVSSIREMKVLGERTPLRVLWRPASACPL